MIKKTLAIAAVAAMAFSFVACEGSDLLGSIKLQATNPVAGTVSSEQAYAEGDSVIFMSALSNVKVDTLAISDTTLAIDTVLYNLDAGTIIVGSVNNITTANFESLSFPLCGINLRGEEAKNYPISCPVDDIAFFQYLKNAKVNDLISSGLAFNEEKMGNLFAIAVSEDAFYIGYDGSVNITKFGGDGSTIDGKVNVKCIYVTVAQLEELVEKGDVSNLSSYFPTVTFNGTVSSRRLPLDTVLEALESSK